MDQAKIKALVLKDGKANWDIAKPSADSSATPDEPASSFKIGLNKYELINTGIIYDDRSLDFRMELEGMNHEGKGDFTEDLFVLQTRSDVKFLSLWYGGVKYISRATALLKADLDMDMPNFKFTFKEMPAGD